MKLLTAVIGPDRIERVTDALKDASLPTATMASGQASGLEGGRILGYKGVTYRDQRCTRIELLVSDLDLKAAVDILRKECGEAPGALIVWASNVEDLAALDPSAELAHMGAGV